MSIEIGKKHKSRKDKKRSPSSSKSKKVEDYNKTKEKSREDQKTRDKSREDKIHKHSKNNVHSSRADISFREKHKNSDKKHTDYSNFDFSFSSSLDNLTPSTSTGNLTYPQVRILQNFRYSNLKTVYFDTNMPLLQYL